MKNCIALIWTLHVYGCQNPENKQRNGEATAWRKWRWQVGHDVKQLKGQKSQDNMPTVSCLPVAPYFIHIFFLSFFLSFKSVMAAKAVDVMYFSHTLSYLFVLWQFISYHFNFKLEYENRKKIIQVQNDGHGTRIHWTRHVCLYKSIKVHESPFFFF